eukprot:COSAG06_NODE_6545_length_2887_cov_2.501793_2_plen_90_part_00
MASHLLRCAILGRFASETAAASTLGEVWRSRNSVGLPSSYPPPGPRSFAAVKCGMGTRLAVDMAQSGVTVNSQGTDSQYSHALNRELNR